MLLALLAACIDRPVCFSPLSGGDPVDRLSKLGLFTDLATPGAYGHGGASGCQLVIDPATDAVIVLLSNTHARAGRELWYIRLQSILNSVFASLA